MTGRERTSTRPPDEREPEPEPEADAREVCPECGGDVVGGDREERVCADCGLVVDDRRIDAGPEWRAFDAADREEKSRVGAPTTNTIHDKGLSTTIGLDATDAYGNALSGRKRRQLSRLRTWNRRARTESARDRNLRHALGEIDRMASALGLPQPVRETASAIYRRALSADLLRGRSIEGMASAALYAASRFERVSRSIEEVTKVSRVEGLEIERAQRYLVRELELGVPPAHPGEYVGRFASELDCGEATERLARELIETVVDAGVHSGKSPVGIAASALYAAGRLNDEGMTQAEVSEATDVSKVTIRNRYREVLSVAEIG